MGQLMYKDREVFPRAPLEFVAGEVRFPFAPRIGKEQTFDLLAEAFRERLPVPSRESMPEGVELRPAGLRVTRAHDLYRFVDLTRTSSISITQTNVTIETTNYDEYSKFRELLQLGILVLRQLDMVVGVERVGLRYIDELRVPAKVQSASDWNGYVAPALLRPLDLAEGYDPKVLEGTIRLSTGHQTGVQIRYGALDGKGVVGRGPLRRRSNAPEGPFFVVDIDSFWEAGEGTVEEFVPDNVLDTFDLLHTPVGTLFLRTITERFKNEVARVNDDASTSERADRT